MKSLSAALLLMVLSMPGAVVQAAQAAEAVPPNTFAKELPPSRPEDLARIAQFEQEQGLTAWPAPFGCRLDGADLKAGPVGMVLGVGEPDAMGKGRRFASMAANSRCHAFHVNFQIVDMPSDLPRGRYVLAVERVAEESMIGAFRVKYRAHLPDSRDNQALICAALWHRVHQAKQRGLKNPLSNNELADDLIANMRLDGCNF